MGKLGVLLLCPFYPPNLGGVETHLRLLTESLAQKGHQVFVLSYRPLTSKGERWSWCEKKRNVFIRRFWWFGYGWFDKLTPYPVLQFFYVVPGLLVGSLVWAIKNKQRFDVVHAHGFAAAFVARIIGLFLPSKRKVVSTHFIYKKLKPGGFYARVFQWVFSGFDQIWLIGKESGRELQALGLDPNRMRVFHHWLDQSRFIPKDKKACRRKLSLPSGVKLVVLFVGRLLRMKGVFELLKVASSLPEEILFVLVGDGPDKETLEVASKGIGNFRLIGRISHEQVIDYYGACDFLILPSQAEEAQPMVIMEALTCGRPVVVTNKGAAKEMIDASVGIVIEPTADNIRRTILQFRRYPRKLAAMTAKARPFALRKFSPKNAKIIIQSYYG